MLAPLLATAASLFPAPLGDGPPPDARAFTILGSESEVRELNGTVPGLATRVGGELVDAVGLPDGRIAVLRTEWDEDESRVGFLERDGRYAEAPADFGSAYAQSLALEATGTLLAVAGERLWRIASDGRATALSEPDAGVSAAAPAADGGYVYADESAVWRVSSSGARARVAGTGREGRVRPGPATASPLRQPTAVAVLPDGGTAFADSDAVWRVSPDGMLSRLAGGGRQRLRRGGGQRATAVELYEVTDLVADRDGTIAVSEYTGVHVVRDDRIRTLLRVEADPASRIRPPRWSGETAARIALPWAPALSITPEGDWLVTSSGVALITQPGRADARFAAAIEPASAHDVWNGRVRVTTTRPATVIVTARSGRERITGVRAVVGAGTHALQLPRRLPPGLVHLELDAHADDHAAVTHRLPVLGTRRLPLEIAEGGLTVYGNAFGDVIAEVERCIRRSASRVRCRLEVSYEGGVDRSWETVVLGRDGVPRVGDVALEIVR